MAAGDLRSRTGGVAVVIRKSLLRWVALAGMALGMALGTSGCALPPIVTAASVAADIFSYGETGKSVTDHGISLVMKQDCALLRAFKGAVCSAHPPAETTPEGALVALVPLGDPSINSAAGDPMTVPRSLAYLEGTLGLAVASAPEPRNRVSTASFVGVSDTPAGAPAPGRLFAAGLTYLTAGIDG